MQIISIGNFFSVDGMPNSLPSTRLQLIQETMSSLRRIVKAIENYSRAVEKQFNLTGPQLWTLWELGQAGPLSLKDLAIRMKQDSSTLVGVLDRLAAKDLVVRNPDPSDRRRISVDLTVHGRNLLAQAPHPAQGYLLRGLDSMETLQLKELHKAFYTLEVALDATRLEVPWFFADG